MKQMDSITKGIYGTQICRTRFIDNAVDAALSEGISQYVFLGAAYDSRPYRLPRLRLPRVFEVDLLSVQNRKKKALSRRLGKLPENVVYIPIDFDKQYPDSAFSGTTFDRAKQTFFVWEGGHAVRPRR